MKKTKVEIITETRDYYAADPVGRRATGCSPHHPCRYITGDGRMCAVGRCLIDPLDYLGGFRTYVEELGIKTSSGSVPEGILQPEYDGHPFYFWSDLQKFHDGHEYWTPTGLSEEGEIYFNNLIDRYKH